MGEGWGKDVTTPVIESQQAKGEDNALGRTYAIVQKRIEGLSDFRKETVKKLLEKNRLTLSLMTAMVLASSGCGNVPNPIELPFLGPDPTPAARTTTTATPTPDNRPISTPIPSPTNTPEATSTPSGPNKLKYKDKFPEDVVSEKELWERYHTRIWNTLNVKLHIRRAALHSEPIFQTLKELIEGKDTIQREVKITTSFDIVLLPGDIVRSKKLTAEQKSKLPDFVEELQNSEAEIFNDYRARTKRLYPEFRDFYQKEIDTIEEEIANGNRSREQLINSIRRTME